MATISMNEITTFRWSFEEDVQNYQALGIDAIAVWRQKLSDFGEEKGLELLGETGLRVSALQWAGGFTGSDGRTFRESVEDALEAVDLAGQLKAHCLIVYSGARAGHTHNHARRLFRHALKELAPAASERGVALAIEPMHVGCAAEWTFLTSLEDALEIIHSTDATQVRLVFDAYHLGHEPGNVGRLAELAPHLALVQLGDARQAPCGEQNRCRLGEGQVPLREIVSALSQVGYEGYYDIELLGEDLDHADYRELILQSKRVAEELFEAAGASCSPR